MIIETKDFKRSFSDIKIYTEMSIDININQDISFYYSALINLVYCSDTKLIVNSAISFFIKLRSYILDNNIGYLFDDISWRYYDLLLERFKKLLDKHRIIIYLYRANIEIREFCDYNGINYVIIKKKRDMERLIKKQFKNIIY